MQWQSRHYKVVNTTIEWVVGLSTHKMPKPKTTLTAAFFREFNCNVQSIGIGKNRMQTSSVRLKMALSRNFMFKFPQCFAISGPGV